MINYKLIGKRIKEVRLQQTMTQEKLAEQADVSVTYISNIECSVKKPSLEVLVNISNVLGVTVDELLAGNQLYNPTDYQTDLDEIMALCSQNEKRLIFELVTSLFHILRENEWAL